MKHVLCAVLCLCASAAYAGEYDPALDQELLLGDFTLDALEEADRDFTLDENNHPVVGFSVSLTFQDLGEGSFSYASDLKMFITPPSGDTLSIGGYDSQDESDLLWDFQGEDSDDSGDYQSGPHIIWDPGLPKGGEWLFTVLNDYGFSEDDIQWNDVVVTLHKIPEPMTLLALSLGGLAALRRR